MGPTFLQTVSCFCMFFLVLWFSSSKDDVHEIFEWDAAQLPDFTTSPKFAVKLAKSFGTSKRAADLL